MIKFCGYDWITEERWGKIHPEKSYVWYDESAVVSKSDTEISLLSKYSPKYFEDIDVESKMGIGLISCTHKFDYGRFDLEVMLPDLPFSWAAFWMWSWSDWPPEIDVFEAYSDKIGSYELSKWSKFFKKQNSRLETNVHVRESGVKLDFPKKPNKFSDIDLRYEFNKYSVVWLPESISFYINDKLIRVIDDYAIVSQFANHKLNVVINNSLYDVHLIHKIKVGEMAIKNFKYTSLV